MAGSIPGSSLVEEINVAEAWRYGSSFWTSDREGGAVDFALKRSCVFNPVFILVGNADAIVLRKVKSIAGKQNLLRKAFYGGRLLL